MKVLENPAHKSVLNLMMDKSTKAVVNMGAVNMEAVNMEAELPRVVLVPKAVMALREESLIAF